MLTWERSGEEKSFSYEEANLRNMPNCGSFETGQVVVSRRASADERDVDKHWSNGCRASPRRSIGRDDAKAPNLNEQFLI